MSLRTVRPAPPGYRWIFVRWFRHWRSGKILYAEDYGLEAWCFLVRAWCVINPNPCRGGRQGKRSNSHLLALFFPCLLPRLMPLLVLLTGDGDQATGEVLKPSCSVGAFVVVSWVWVWLCIIHIVNSYCSLSTSPMFSGKGTRSLSGLLEVDKIVCVATVRSKG